MPFTINMDTGRIMYGHCMDIVKVTSCEASVHEYVMRVMKRVKERGMRRKRLMREVTLRRKKELR